MKKEKLNIVYEDKELIVVNKKAGLLTIGTDKEKEKTLYHQVSEYLKKQNKNNKVFVVHRLDKDTSGLVLFAKNQKVKYLMQERWPEVKREYIAIVNGVLNKNKDIIKSYLKETKTHLVYSTNDKTQGLLAITEYEKLCSNDKYTLLKINIKTGRKNQIRVHLNDIGYPIVGDKKYAKDVSKNIKRLYLQATVLEFLHPLTEKKISLSLTYPLEFNKLITYDKDIH